jgi:hypothetical protein
MPHRAKGTLNPLKVKFITPRKATAYVDDQEVGQLGADSVQVLGNLTVVVEATDSVSAVEKLELFVDGKLRATGTTTPFSWRWPTGSETTGLHELMVRARDRAGNERVARLRVATLAR